MFKLFYKILALFIINIFFLNCSNLTEKTGKNETNPSKKIASESKEPMSKKWGKVTIRFRMETQDDVYGFNIYRGESEKGPFEKINKDIIIGGGTTTTPKNYEFVDKPLILGKTYFYYLEEQTNSGHKNNITGINPKVVDTPLTLKEVKNLGLKE
jgi:hypothetical protein